MGGAGLYSHSHTRGPYPDSQAPPYASKRWMGSDPDRLGPYNRRPEAPMQSQAAWPHQDAVWAQPPPRGAGGPSQQPFVPSQGRGWENAALQQAPHAAYGRPVGGAAGPQYYDSGGGGGGVPRSAASQQQHSQHQQQQSQPPSQALRPPAGFQEPPHRQPMPPQPPPFRGAESLAAHFPGELPSGLYPATQPGGWAARVGAADPDPADADRLVPVRDLPAAFQPLFPHYRCAAAAARPLRAQPRAAFAAPHRPFSGAADPPSCPPRHPAHNRYFNAVQSESFATAFGSDVNMVRLWAVSTTPAAAILIKPCTHTLHPVSDALVDHAARHATARTARPSHPSLPPPPLHPLLLPPAPACPARWCLRPRARARRA
jgi:hypothetical protein